MPETALKRRCIQGDFPGLPGPPSLAGRQMPPYSIIHVRAAGAMTQVRVTAGAQLPRRTGRPGWRSF